MLEYFDVADNARLYRNGRLEILKSGNGVMAGSYRKPIFMGGHYYYRLAEGAYIRIDKEVKERFDVTLKADGNWFYDEAMFIEKHNTALKAKKYKEMRAREKAAAKKRGTIKKFLDGKITYETAVTELGEEVVGRLVDEGPTSGTMKKRAEAYTPFNEFTSSVHFEELDKEAWGFGKRPEK